MCIRAAASRAASSVVRHGSSRRRVSTSKSRFMSVPRFRSFAFLVLNDGLRAVCANGFGVNTASRKTQSASITRLQGRHVWQLDAAEIKPPIAVRARVEAVVEEVSRLYVGADCVSVIGGVVGLHLRSSRVRAGGDFYLFPPGENIQRMPRAGKGVENAHFVKHLNRKPHNSQSFCGFRPHPRMPGICETPRPRRTYKLSHFMPIRVLPNFLV